MSDRFISAEEASCYQLDRRDGNLIHTDCLEALVKRKTYFLFLESKSNFSVSGPVFSHYTDCPVLYQNVAHWTAENSDRGFKPGTSRISSRGATRSTSRPRLLRVPNIRVRVQIVIRAAADVEVCPGRRGQLRVGCWRLVPET
jgi:hypothetical protein